MTRLATVSATAAETESMPQWQQKSRGGRQRAKAQTAEPVAQVGGPPQATTAAAAAILQASAPKGEVSTAKWQHGWGELSVVEMDNRVGQLQEMGFSASAARSALAVCDWDVNAALDCLATHDVPAVSTNPHSDPLKVVFPNYRRKASVSWASDSTSASGECSPLMTPEQSLTGPLLSPLLMPSVPLLPPSLAETDVRLGLPPRHHAFAQATPHPTTQPVNNVANIMGSQIQNAATGAAANRALSVSVVPNRKLAKVDHTWDCEPQCADTQMSIEEDSFVYVWSQTKTSAGWVYAESLMCGSRAGWLPASMLQQLPPHKCWMRVSKPCGSIYPTQLSVELGTLVLVDIMQPAVGDGWVYAEQCASATGCNAVDYCGKTGWVPIQCIVWAEV